MLNTLITFSNIAWYSFDIASVWGASALQFNILCKIMLITFIFPLKG